MSFWLFIAIYFVAVTAGAYFFMSRRRPSVKVGDVKTEAKAGKIDRRVDAYGAIYFPDINEELRIPLKKVYDNMYVSLPPYPPLYVFVSEGTKPVYTRVDGRRYPLFRGIARGAIAVTYDVIQVQAISDAILATKASDLEGMERASEVLSKLAGKESGEIRVGNVRVVVPVDPRAFTVAYASFLVRQGHDSVDVVGTLDEAVRVAANLLRKKETSYDWLIRLIAVAGGVILAFLVVYSVLLR